jgi:molecular chaperone DnaK (HSP70)
MGEIIVSEIDLLIQELRDTIDNQRETIDRLNNIINELEKWLKDNIEYGDDDYYDMKAMGVESSLNKLKELKENNK